METKSRRKTKEGMEKREQRRREGKRKNSRCRFPRSFCLLRFLSRRKMKLLLYQSPFPFPRSLCGRRTNIQASLAPSLVCFLSIHPSSSSSRLTFSRLPTFERAHASLVKFARLRTKPTFFSSCTHPRRLLGYLRFLQRLRTEFSSSSSCLILALSVLQSLSCPPRISLPPFRQIKFLEERRKDHLPFFRPSGNLKPVPLY